MGLTDNDIPRKCDEQLLFYTGRHNMKQAAFVVLGIVASVVFFMLLGFLILEKFLHIHGCNAMAIGFLIIIPISLLVGSMVTGFLSRPLLDTKWGLIWITPGLYLVILMISISAIFMIMEAIASDVKSACSGILGPLFF